MPSPVKCKNCKKRDATSKDGLCDTCRFVLVLDNIAEERAITCARERMKKLSRDRSQ